MTGEFWMSLGNWWISELDFDPVYREEIDPLLLELLDPHQGGRYLDVGCGDGRLLRKLGLRPIIAIGCDINLDLLGLARRSNQVVRARLPDLRFLRSSSLDGVSVGLVLEHIADEVTFFSCLAEAVRAGGVLALVINHPVWTAPESSPIEDQSGETLWRPGRYFERGFSDEPAGRQTVRFYHRSLAELLTAASEAGWDLDRMEERGVSRAQMHRYPEYGGQEHIPRLMGARWIRR